MKLYTYEIHDTISIGAARDGRLVDVSGAGATDMLTLIRQGEAGLEEARFIHSLPEAPSYDFADVKLLAPLPRPGKILCSGINYVGHKEENPNATMPEEPFFFSKLPTAVIGPGEPIVLPPQSKQVDYEVEFTVVIGKQMKNTPEAEVMGSIFGYTILHDVSARDVQFKDNQITLGKNFDTFSPLGPCIVTTDDLPDPERRGLRTFLNGQLMQNGTTAEWVFSLPTMLSFLSRVMTLEPGDVVSTGTPAGTGFFRKPQVFLQAGDVVRLEIDGIGVLENPVVAG
jgi:2-keto-4-pentenoate hydratase/2-oxohepta-3-ene-1,7-dioic acid hydratase in catechol pathway